MHNCKFCNSASVMRLIKHIKITTARWGNE